MQIHVISKELIRLGMTPAHHLPLESETGRSAVVDVGTIGIIKRGLIKVSISLDMK
jgi:hypothetical protein